MANDLKIETGIPMPARNANKGDGLLDTWKIGDSVLLPEQNFGKTEWLRQAARYRGQRVAGRREAGGIRYWRLS